MKIIFTLMMLVIVTSCGSNNNGNNSKLIGVWKTEACEQTSDVNNNLIDVWLKGIYQFTSNGTIKFRSEPYSDSNCTTRISKVNLNDVESSAIFQESGEETLEEGISGNGIIISFINEVFQVEKKGFYTINNDVLCFSAVYFFGAGEFGVFPDSEITAINFERCLVLNI